MSQAAAHRRLRELAADRRGAAAVEFALLLPILCLVLAGLIDASRLVSRSMQVRAAAQAGADYAQRKGWNAAAVASAVTAAAAEVTAAPAPRRHLGCVSGLTVVETTDPNGACADGNKPGEYVRVNAQASFRTVVPWPAVILPSQVSAAAVVRIR